MKLTTLGPSFAVAVEGMDLTQPGPALAADCWRLFDTHAVVVFRQSRLDDPSHVAFSRLFGDLEMAPNLAGRRARFAVPEMFDAGNIDADGRIVTDERRRLINLGNQQWHTDSSFRPARSSYSMLRAHRIPRAGGETEFVDLRAAYDALPPALRQRIEGLEAEHSYWHSRQLVGYPAPTPEERAAIPGARQPLVLRHPRTGRPSLYLAAHAAGIVGMDEGEGRALLAELMDFATQERFRYVHEWRQDDLVVWDNLCTMHRATPFDDTREVRDMRRTTVVDGSGLAAA